MASASANEWLRSLLMAVVAAGLAFAAQRLTGASTGSAAVLAALVAVVVMLSPVWAQLVLALRDALR